MTHSPDIRYQSTPKPPQARPRDRHQSGQSMTEYVVLCAVVALVLGVGMVDDSSPLRQLLNAFHEAYERVSFSLSLP